MTNGRRSPTPDEFQEQISALEELQSVENRLRWVPRGAIERLALGFRRAQLNSEIAAWNRRFAAGNGTT